VRSEQRILTTHVGSLVRPADLVELLLRLQDNEPVDPALLDERLAAAVEWVVREQQANGVDVVSDGEYGKSITWSLYVVERLSGIEQRTDVAPDERRHRTSNDQKRFADFYAEYTAEKGVAGMGRELKLNPGVWVATEEIRYTGQAALHADIARLKAAMAAAGVGHGFLPVVAPVSATPMIVDRHYGSEEAFLFRMAEALREEYRAIIEAGLMLQVDDAYLAYTYDMMVPPATMADYRKWAEMGVEALNHALRGLPPERIRYHVCWGSWNGPHTNDVDARDIVDLILKVNAGGYLLEMANPRHEHEWRLWESVKLPEGKVLYPGVVSHATNVVEHPELVAERIVRLARLVGRENVIASTDCGFAQGPFTRRVHPSIMWAKLAAIAEGACLASAELWGKAPSGRIGAGAVPA
jgi:5-methyltetrahydropteroyltriglutamate--homocysteine methyltransferase